jgi:hypothetical protein
VYAATDKLIGAAAYRDAALAFRHPFIPAWADFPQFGCEVEKN